MILVQVDTDMNHSLIYRIFWTPRRGVWGLMRSRGKAPEGVLGKKSPRSWWSFLCLRSVSRRRSRLHECTPCRSIPSASPCRRQAKIERAQIVLDRSQPGLPGWVFRFCVASLWEDPECRLAELGNGLDWHLHVRGLLHSKYCTVR